MNISGPEGQEAMQAEVIRLRAVVEAARARIARCEQRGMTARIKADAYDDLRAILTRTET